MNQNSTLNASRRKVQAILKERMKRYLNLMGSWFKGKLSKDEFDAEARALFTDDTVHAHNEFLLEMLSRCQSVSNTLGARDLNRPSITMQSPPQPAVQRQKSVKKKPFVKANFTQRFQPANQLRQVQLFSSPPSHFSKATFASLEHGLIPDPGMIEGRLYVGAWEAGLENVQNDIYSLIAHATENMLKNVVSHVISCRRGYQVSRTDSVRRYAGLDVPAIYLQSASPELSQATGDKSLQEAEQEEAAAVRLLARAGHVTHSNEPLTALDMFTALRSNPDVLGSFTIYTLAMERLSARLYHRDACDVVSTSRAAQPHR